MLIVKETIYIDTLQDCFNETFFLVYISPRSTQSYVCQALRLVLPGPGSMSHANSYLLWCFRGGPSPVTGTDGSCGARTLAAGLLKWMYFITTGLCNSTIIAQESHDLHVPHKVGFVCLDIMVEIVAGVLNSLIVILFPGYCLWPFGILLSLLVMSIASRNTSSCFKLPCKKSSFRAHHHCTECCHFIDFSFIPYLELRGMKGP